MPATISCASITASRGHAWQRDPRRLWWI